MMLDEAGAAEDVALAYLVQRNGLLTVRSTINKDKLVVDEAVQGLELKVLNYGRFLLTAMHDG